jgi:predicted Ser/Thr protein kinase
MADGRRCPQCGVEVLPDAPEGLCPGCLLKAGLRAGDPSSGGPPTTGGDRRAESFVLPTPAELAPYFPDLEILELLGRGGMGVVYKARQKRLDRLVALKILSPKIAAEPAFAERFAREARAMAMLSHPHIVAVYDFGQTPALPSLGRATGGEGMGSVAAASEDQGRPYYFLMEFVDGVNLGRLLETGRLAPEQALAIVPQVCDALQYAHDHGVVHRDIKPGNLLLDRQGRVKIADFGLAKLIGPAAPDLTLTGAGQVMGTPQYMAPEQIEQPQRVDHRADIYSLGVVFYQMLTGELPIGRFAPPSRKVEVDVRLDQVVLRALEKEPELRYQQAGQIKTDVQTISSTPGAAAPAPVRSEAPAEARADAERVFLARCALVLFIAGLAAPLSAPMLSERDTAIGLAGGFGLICEVLAFILGIAGRRHLSGRIAMFGGAITLVWVVVMFSVYWGMRSAAPTRPPEDRPLGLFATSGSWRGETLTGSIGPYRFASDSELKTFNFAAAMWLAQRGFEPDTTATFSEIVEADSRSPNGGTADGWKKPGRLLCRRCESQGRIWVFIPECYRPETRTQYVGYHFNFPGSVEEVLRCREEWNSLKLEFLKVYRPRGRAEAAGAPAASAPAGPAAKPAVPRAKASSPAPQSPAPPTVGVARP